MKIVDLNGRELDSGEVIFQDQNQEILISYAKKLGRGILVKNGTWITTPTEARKELEKHQISGFLVVADDCDSIVLSKYHAGTIQQQRQQQVVEIRQERRPDFKKRAANDDS